MSLPKLVGYMFVAALTAGTCAAQTSERIVELVKKLHDSSSHPPMLVIAHRSCWWDGAPENSLTAIRECLAMGVDGIELDVVKTSDGQLIAMHDKTVNRMTEGKGDIAQMTLAQVTALHLRARFGGEFAPVTEEHVPTVEEALRLAKDHFLVHLHLKVPNEEAEVAKLIDRMGMKEQVTVWLGDKPGDASVASSPLFGHANVISTVNECVDASPCTPMPVTNLTGFAPYHPVAFNVNFKDHEFLAQVISAPRPADVRIAGNTLYGYDTGAMDQLIAEWNKQMDLGVSLIMTNRPKELMDLVKKREAH